MDNNILLNYLTETFISSRRDHVFLKVHCRGCVLSQKGRQWKLSCWSRDEKGIQTGTWPDMGVLLVLEEPPGLGMSAGME